MANAANENAPEKDNKPEGGEEDADTKLANLVNSAVTSQLKRHMKNLGDSFGSMLDERLASLNLGKKEEPKPSKGEEAKDTNEKESAAMSEIEKLRGELKAEKARAAEKEVFADIRALLVGKVRPEALDMAIKVLKADGLVKINARDGSVKLKSAEGDVELADGLEEWLKSDGAIFAPVPQAKPKPRITGPTKAPSRPASGGSGDEGLTPAQKALRALQAKGLSI